ncbi:LOW PSII ACCUMULATION 1, chloroplastic-like protein [Drosera capensis]
MAAAALIQFGFAPLSLSPHRATTPRFLPRFLLCSNKAAVCSRSSSRPTVSCSAANRDSSAGDISSAARIRSEVLSPFRSLRMFFYLAFVASGSLGGFIAGTQLIGALANPSRAAEVSDSLNSLAIDMGAVSLFAFLYFRDKKTEDAQVARLVREETLSRLKVRINENKIVPVSSLRGVARLVILAGPGSFIQESYERSGPFADGLRDRGVLVIPFATDGKLPSFQAQQNEDFDELSTKKSRLWQLLPVYASEWSKWLDEQKKLANVSSDSPVYMSLRMDGRVRGSGIGYPPWNAFVAQLPPVKGIWSGLLDGMDGRELWPFMSRTAAEPDHHAME